MDGTGADTVLKVQGLSCVCFTSQQSQKRPAVTTSRTPRDVRGEEMTKPNPVDADKLWVERVLREKMIDNDWFVNLVHLLCIMAAADCNEIIIQNQNMFQILYKFILKSRRTCHYIV